MNFGNLGNFFEQFQNAQKRLQEIQEDLASKYAEGNAGGGKVTAMANGRQQLLKVQIDPELLESGSDELVLLEDMIVAAVNQALERSRELATKEMSELTGGLPLQDLLKKFQI